MTGYVGFDVSKEETAFCVKDAAGKVLACGKAATDPAALSAVIKVHCGHVKRVVMETGTFSGWLARELGKRGVAVDVIDARRAHAVMRLQHNKTDANDAELLGEPAPADGPGIARLDKVVMAHAKAEARSRLLMTAPGVGPITALGYVATIDDAGRFAKSRAVGATLGLTSRRWQSGEMDYSGRISKQGDAMLRSLLTEAANSLLSRVGKAHPLKDWARRIKRRTSHKKACVALARRLAVILHRMLITGEAFRWPQPETATRA